MKRIKSKCATEGINGLKGVHGLQLALHLPEGSEIRRQIFDNFDTDEMKGNDGWNGVIDLLKLHCKQVFLKHDWTPAVKKTD